MYRDLYLLADTKDYLKFLENSNEYKALKSNKLLKNYFSWEPDQMLFDLIKEIGNDILKEDLETAFNYLTEVRNGMVFIKKNEKFPIIQLFRDFVEPFTTKSKLMPFITHTKRRKNVTEYFSQNEDITWLPDWVYTIYLKGLKRVGYKEPIIMQKPLWYIDPNLKTTDFVDLYGKDFGRDLISFILSGIRLEKVKKESITDFITSFQIRQRDRPRYYGKLYRHNYNTVMNRSAKVGGENPQYGLDFVSKYFRNWNFFDLYDTCTDVTKLPDDPLPQFARAAERRLNFWLPGNWDEEVYDVYYQPFRDGWYTSNQIPMEIPPQKSFALEELMIAEFGKDFFVKNTFDYRTFKYYTNTKFIKDIWGSIYSNIYKGPIVFRINKFNTITTRKRPKPKIVLDSEYPPTTTINLKEDLKYKILNKYYLGQGADIRSILHQYVPLAKSPTTKILNSYFLEFGTHQKDVLYRNYNNYLTASFDNYYNQRYASYYTHSADIFFETYCMTNLSYSSVSTDSSFYDFSYYFGTDIAEYLYNYTSESIFYGFCSLFCFSIIYIYKKYY